MSEKDPLVESVIAALLKNAATQKGNGAFIIIGGNLNDLFSLYEKKLISKERIYNILLSVRESQSYHDSEVSMRVDDITMKLLTE